MPGRVGIEPGAVVLDHQRQALVDHQLDAERGGGRMDAHVGQRLLEDAVGRPVDRRREVPAIALEPHGGVEA